MLPKVHGHNVPISSITVLHPKFLSVDLLLSTSYPRSLDMIFGVLKMHAEEFFQHSQAEIGRVSSKGDLTSRLEADRGP